MCDNISEFYREYFVYVKDESLCWDCPKRSWVICGRSNREIKQSPKYKVDLNAKFKERQK